MEVSNKEHIHGLRDEVVKIADPYRSPLIREKTLERLQRDGIQTDGTRASFENLHLPEESFDPHVTLGEIEFGKPQADVEESRKNLASVEGREIVVSGITVFFYKREDEAGKYELAEKVAVPFAA